MRQELAGGTPDAHLPGLLADARYGPAARFFLSDLYGPKDFPERDDEIERIPADAGQALPLSGLTTLALAIELDALSEDLDAGMIGMHCGCMERSAISMTGPMPTPIATAGRPVQTPADQPDRRYRRGTGGTGTQAVDRHALKLMKDLPMAGLGELHTTFERGFTTSSGWAGTNFWRRSKLRKTALMNGWLGGALNPFFRPTENTGMRYQSQPAGQT